MTITIPIASVAERRLKGGQVKFDVYPVRPAGHRGWTPIYETWNPWVASLCQRSSELKKDITLTVMEKDGYLEIVSVALDAELVL